MSQRSSGKSVGAAHRSRETMGCGHPRRATLIALVVLLLSLLSCSESRPRVVVYAALDRVFSESILDEFERRTGIEVRVQFDTEASKTSGLVERIRREKSRPQCDVFWNNEIVRTIQLAREGLLQPYQSKSAATIPSRFKDPQHHWTGFAARARVVAFDPQRVRSQEVPRTIDALLELRWKGKAVLANPQFGSTGTHLAFVFAARGERAARELLTRLANHEVEIVGSNSTSRDRVVAGQAQLGLTDTDDVEVVRRQGASLDDVLMEEKGGVVLIPNTLSLVAGCAHSDAGRQLIDYLLSEEVEAKLAASPSRQIPLRASVRVPAGGLKLSELTVTPVSYDEAADALPVALRAARELLH